MVEWNGSTRKNSTPTSLLVALIVLALSHSSQASLLAFATLPAQSPGDVEFIGAYVPVLEVAMRWFYRRKVR